MAGITVLGAVAVQDEGSALSPRDRVVLSVLVSRRDNEVSADTFAEALWGDHPPPTWAKVVQGCVVRLRQRLGPGAIVTGPRGYRLAVPAEAVDAGRFERLVHRARELLALDHADQAAYTIEEALGLWHGEPLADLENWEPGRGEARRLTELRLQAQELRLAALLASGRHAEVLPEATLLVREGPLRERRWALLARAQYQDGRQADALATLRRAREVLAEELGLDPGAELVDLERAVLRQDPTLAVPSAEVPAATCPWPGLAAYDVDDADAFFGRDREVDDCLARLDRNGFLAVVGPSGSGKSSLARAGIAARLTELGRTVRTITPGPRPLDALAAATAGRGDGRVLVVDQCEEIFAPSVPAPVREAFLSRLAEHASRHAVVLTLRADRLGELSEHTALARLVEDGLYLLKGISREGIRQTIEEPARQAGLLLEEGLVDLLVRDVEDEPGSLPLLAHALRQTWERREGTTLTVGGYRASGGIRGAVARSAEQVYEDASAEQRHALRELLLRMVQPGPGGEPVRTSVPSDVVTADAEHAALLEQLVRARLVTTAADRVEIAHEALARAWPRLQDWLADDVEGERIRHHLAAAAQAWEAMDRPSSELYRGARLEAAREWHATGAHRLSRLESEFLAASEAAHRSHLAQAQEEARRQRTVNRRLRLLVAGATVLALVAAAFGVVAQQQWQRGEEAQAALSLEADRARSHELAASAVAAVEEDPALAKALAVLGAEAAPPTFQSRDALHRTIAADQIVSRVSMNHHRRGRLWAELHPEGDRVAMAAESGYFPRIAVEVHDALTGELIWEWVRPDAPGYQSAVVVGATYSPDGAILASGVIWHPTSDVRLGPPLDSAPPPAEGLLGVHLWDARTHEELAVVDVGPCGGWPMAVAGDHLLVRALVAPPSQDLDAQEEAALLGECRWEEGAMGTFAVDRATGESHLLTVVEALNLDFNVGHALSHDGSLAVVPDFVGGSGVLFDTSDGSEVTRLEPGSFGYDFTASGDRLLLNSQKNPEFYHWQVVSLPDLTTLATFTEHGGHSYYGRFGPDDTSVFTTGLDNRLFQWDAGSGEVLRRLGAVGAGAPTSSGDLVLVPRPDTAGAVLVDTTPPSELWSLPSCRGLTAVDWLRVTGELVVVGRNCDGAQAGRLETITHSGEPVQSWEGISWEAFDVSPDGRRLVSRDGAGTSETGRPMVGPLRVRDLHTGEVKVTLEGFCDHLFADTFTGIPADDPALQTCGGLGEPPFTFTAWTVTWSPDGRFIAAVDGAMGGVGVWDGETGRMLTSLGTPDEAGRRPWHQVYDAEFSPQADRLLLSTWSGHLVALDTATWQSVATRQIDTPGRSSAGVVGHAADGSLVVVNPLEQNAANTSILLVDPDTLSVRQVWSDVAEGTVQSAALSPDATRVALVTRDGVVSVWDLQTRTLLDQADPGLGSLEAVQWLDDSSLVVVSLTGHVSTVSTDAELLLDLARSTLTRGLTQSECGTYQVDPCPSLTALRGSGPTVPEELRGSYTVTWSPEDLESAAVGRAESAHGSLDGVTLDRLAAQSELLAGTYRLDLRDSDYTITRDEGGEVWCTGAVISSAGRPGRILLGADSGTGCVDFHYAELGWELEDDRLTVPHEEFRGGYFDALLWTAKPLQKVG